MSWTRRKPIPPNWKSALFQLRLETRRSTGLPFQDPPRSTRRPPVLLMSRDSGAAGFPSLFRHHSQRFPAISITPCLVAPRGYMPTAVVRRNKLLSLLHRTSSHPAHGYSHLGSPPVAACCHSHSNGKRIVDLVFDSTNDRRPRLQTMTHSLEEH